MEELAKRMKDQERATPDLAKFSKLACPCQYPSWFFPLKIGRACAKLKA
jgi:hypothetical protein